MVWTGLVGEQSGFLMTNGRGCLATISLRLQPVRRHASLGKRNLEFRAKFPGEIPLALDSHRLPGRAENGPRRCRQFLRPRRLRPINGLRDHHVHPSPRQQRAGIGIGLARKNRPGQLRREMAVIARQVSGHIRPGFFERLAQAVREGADAKDHDVAAALWRAGRMSILAAGGLGARNAFLSASRS